jgi:diguanylate cyclase (GGDEF)-like protein
LEQLPKKKKLIILEGASLTAEGLLADNPSASNMTIISMPLMSSSQLLGVMCILTDGTKPFEFQELYIAEMFAVQASATMENARLLTEVQRLATTDDLSGLYNRRAFMEIAQLEFERFLRYGAPLSVFMFDIDKFKKLNDQWGHLIGDEVLKELGKLCKHSMRNIDILGRYGGEEFIALLPQTELAEALQAAERLRSLIDTYPFYCRDQCLHITISIGVVEAQSQDKTLDALLDRVDQAMYRAKAAGRNTVST